MKLGAFLFAITACVLVCITFAVRAESRVLSVVLVLFALGLLMLLGTIVAKRI